MFKSNSKLNIVIIDSGVRLSHPLFNNTIIQSYELSDNDDFKRVYTDNDEYGHGTAMCGLIVNSLLKQNIIANISMIKAFNKENSDNDNVEKALSIVEHYFSPDVLNLSFGIIDGHFSRISELCEKLSKKCFIISAADNSGFLSIPCSLRCVIGVASDPSISNLLEYDFFEEGTIQMLACGKTQRVSWIFPDYCLMDGNSVACANATGIVAGIVYNNRNIKNFDDILVALSQNARMKVCAKMMHKKYTIKHAFDIKKAAIFPFSKETSSLVLFSDILDFDITDVYDIPMSCKVGAKVSDILKLNVPQDFKVKSVDDFSSHNIDTLILGHVSEYMKYPKEYARIEKLMSKCSNVAIYAFDSAINNDHIFSPLISSSYKLPYICGGMLHYIHTPVLAVLGTSSKQGKFTLQLHLRKNLIMRGYNVGQLGTEPQSALFGMDSVFAMGYNSNVNFSDNDVILYLNRVLHDIENERDIDIIITGSQSGMIPYSYGHLGNYTLKQHIFLLGTRPDAVVLCVNLFDDVDYIGRTIKYIEGAVKTKVLSLVLYPKVKKSVGIPISINNLDTFDIKKHCNELRKHFNLPTFVLGEDMDLLCDEIINYFT